MTRVLRVMRQGLVVSAALGLMLGLTADPGAAGDGASVRVSPGEDVQGALDAAPAGGTVVLAAGEHRGPVVLRQRLTLRGEAGTRLIGTGRGSVLTVEAEGATARGLEIAGSGLALAQDDAGVLVRGDGVELAELRLRENLHGIYVRGAKRVRLVGNEVAGLAATAAPPAAAVTVDGGDDGIHHSPPGTQSLIGNGIHLWNADGATVLDNRIAHVRDGIYVSHTNGASFRRNAVQESRYGIHYMYSDENALEANDLRRNVAGAALMFSRNLTVTRNVLREHSGFRAYGLLLQDVDASLFEDNVIRGNRVGMRLQSSNGNTFRGNVVAGNLASMTINSSSQDNILTRNDFGLNLRQVELTGPAPPTQWSLEGVGNRWHGALPLDLTGDGVSQWPHHEVDVMGERRERFPATSLLTGSIGIQALEWALSRAPLPGSRHITDPHPLTRGGGGE